MSPTRLLQFALLTAALFVLGGCVTETREVNEQPRNPDGTPYEVLRVPQQMQEVSGDLLRYHARFSTLPTSLETLMDERIMTPQRFAELPGYAYHPRGLGQLRDGRVVILVDDQVRIEGHAWCIVREPSAAPRSIQLNVTPVALRELEAAARNAR